MLAATMNSSLVTGHPDTYFWMLETKAPILFKFRKKPTYDISPSDLQVQDLPWENPVLRIHRAKPCFPSEWQTRKPRTIMLISRFKSPSHNHIPPLSVFRLKVTEFTNHLTKLHSLNPWQIMWSCWFRNTNLPFHCPNDILVNKTVCLGLQAMKHTVPRSNWFHQAAENRKEKKCREEGRSTACLSKKEKKSYFQSRLSLSVPYLLLIGKKEVENMKMLWKTFIRVLSNCLHQRWQFAAWLISFESFFWFCASQGLAKTLKIDQDKVAQSSAGQEGAISSIQLVAGTRTVVLLWILKRHHA